MSSNNRDEIISRFIAITQCSSSQAREYLEAAKWNEQAAMDFFFDSGGDSQARAPTPNTSVQSKPNTKKPETYEDDDDDLIQSALEESLQIKPSVKPSSVVPDRTDRNKSIISSKINTVDRFRKNADEDSDDDDEGQAFYAGGSEHSGQQIIGPSKGRDNDKKVTKIFDAVRKQGAKEADDDDDDEPRTKRDKAFAGVGYSLGNEQTPSRPQGQTPSGSGAGAAPAAASNTVEQLLIRFYSNGFTVGDGELRKFEENREFMEYIKRGEVPPELRNMNTNGKQIEVRLEDHRGEEYKRVAPTFKPFGGAGHTVGLPPGSGQTQVRSSIAQPVYPPSAGPPDANRLEQLAEKRLKTTSSSTTIRLRLPDISAPVSIRIDLNRSLADVRRFLNENVPSLQSNTFEFLEPPSTKIKREDEKRKISDTKLSNSTLAVRQTA